MSEWLVRVSSGLLAGQYQSLKMRGSKEQSGVQMEL